MAGKIITIEGLDGAGKSTQIDLLVNRLNLLGVKHKFIHFPTLNDGTYGNIISEYLRGEFGSVENVHPKLVALLFAENRNEQKNKLLQWMNEGNLIIMDRYVNSNIAFQCAKTKNILEKNILKNWILEFEYGNNKLPIPSLSLFLHVPFEIVSNSLKKPRMGEGREYLNGKVDIHEDSLELQKNVYNEYLNLIKEQRNFFEIKCFSDDSFWLSPQYIHELIFNKIQNINSYSYGSN